VREKLGPLKIVEPTYSDVFLRHLDEILRNLDVKNEILEILKILISFFKLSLDMV
jgi:hypothetical protein